MSAKKTIAIAGAGTMGAGIALTALYAGYFVILQDPFPDMLEKAKTYIQSFLDKKGKSQLISNLLTTSDLSDFAPASLVIEAAPEKLEIKKELFAAFERICSADAILVTNTSTLSVTAIAASTSSPQRVAGLHFFNPAPVMPLVEVIRAAQSDDQTVEACIAFAQDLGKTPVLTKDTPGFIVNRLARPFYGESLRILGEGAVSHAEIDEIIEAGAGFRMGPFRLMDLIGIDVNAGAMRSLYEQSFGEARYRPHPIQLQKLAEGALGRKSGRGFYKYSNGNETPEISNSPKKTDASGEIRLSSGTWAPGLNGMLQQAGYQIQSDSSRVALVAAFIRAGRDELALSQLEKIDSQLPEHLPIFIQASDIAFSEVLQSASHPQRLIAYDGLFIADGSIATLVASSGIPDSVRQAAQALFASLGLRIVWIKESPALVLPRIICQLVNEAVFAFQEGIADADTLDLAMRLGVNYPLGPLEWGKKIGYVKVLAVLDHLYAEFHEDRYRASSLLRRWARQ